MTDSEKTAGPAEVPRRFKRYPYGALYVRLLGPLVAVVVGTWFVIRGVIGLADVSILLVGIGLIALAGIGFFVARGMARRGI